MEITNVNFALNTTNHHLITWIVIQLHCFYSPQSDATETPEPTICFGDFPGNSHSKGQSGPY